MTHLVSVMPRSWPLLFLSCLVYDPSCFCHASFMTPLVSVMPRLWPLFFLSCLVYDLSSFRHALFMTALLSVMPCSWPLLSVMPRSWPLLFLSCLIYDPSCFCHALFMTPLVSVMPRLWPLLFLSCLIYDPSCFCHASFMTPLVSVMPRLWPLFFLSCLVYDLSSFCHASCLSHLLSSIPGMGMRLRALDIWFVQMTARMYSILLARHRKLNTRRYIIIDSGVKTCTASCSSLQGLECLLWRRIKNSVAPPPQKKKKPTQHWPRNYSVLHIALFCGEWPCLLMAKSDVCFVLTVTWSQHTQSINIFIATHHVKYTYTWDEALCPGHSQSYTRSQQQFIHMITHA